MGASASRKPAFVASDQAAARLDPSGFNPARVDKLKVLSLFAGIGGFDLGLERTGGFKTVAFCEIDPFCQRVLAKHWPGVPIYDDVRELRGEQVAPIDVICGGFPCQDISLAGLGAGIHGERSGLWSEYARLIGELRPRFVIVENVRALLVRGIDAVLGALASLGFDAEWHVIPAAAVGAPHRRDRVWLVAYTGGQQHQGHSSAISRALAEELSRAATHAAPLLGSALIGGEPDRDHAGTGEVADSESFPVRTRLRENEPPGERWGRLGYRSGAEGQWAAEPDVGRVAHGVPSRVDRLRSLGNAVVPQIPELIGRAILEAGA